MFLTLYANNLYMSSQHHQLQCMTAQLQMVHQNNSLVVFVL